MISKVRKVRLRFMLTQEQVIRMRTVATYPKYLY